MEDRFYALPIRLCALFDYVVAHLLLLIHLLIENQRLEDATERYYPSKKCGAGGGT
jgi:hypothetical protein